MSSRIDNILALAKVPFLVTKAIILIKALTPPNIASESEQVEAKGFERVFKLTLGVPLIVSKV
jgi:predicted nucleotidyltransferase